VHPAVSVIMAQTAQYCIQCLMDLSPANALSPEDRLILRVLGFLAMDGAPDYAKHFKTVAGMCQKCGKDSVLIYYEVSASLPAPYAGGQDSKTEINGKEKATLPANIRKQKSDSI
jgi:hypothetical protein